MSKFSVKKPLTIFMTVIVVMILGFVSYTRMTPDLLPNIDLPYVVIMTTYPGATPEKVETVIAKPMEQSLATLDNIKNIQSISSSNASTMILEFSDDVNMDTVSVDILQKINLIEGYWDDTVGTPIILKLNPNMLPVAVAAVSRDGMDQEDLSAFVEDTLLNKLEGTDGVASISTTGVLETKTHVVITQEKIDEANEKIRAGIDAQMDAAMEAQMAEMEAAMAEQMPEPDPEVLAKMLTVEQAKQYGMDVSNLTMEEALEKGINVLGMTAEEAQEQGLTVIAASLQEAEAAAAAAKQEAEDAFQEAKEQAYAQADLNKIISMDMVAGLLQAENFAMPEGYVEQDGVSYLVSVGDELESLEEVENLLIMDPGMEDVDPVYLKDVAEINMVDNAEELYAKINGQDGIMFSFSKQSDYATAKTSTNIQEKFAELEEEYEGLHFVTLMDQGDYIYMVISSIIQSLLQGAFFSVIILFLFLRDWKPTLITLFSIPVSVVFAFVLMYFSGITLNMISMSGLAISVGMLVDNSVVVIENIYRLRNKGVSAVKAAVSGASQVGGAIAASTLTTICVFAPIVFVDGVTRELFTDLALTLAYSLLASLLIALTLVPAMASGLLKKTKQKENKLFNGFLNGYRKLLAWNLKFKPVILLLVIGLLGFSVYAVLQKGFTYMPDMNMPQLTVNVELPEEADFEDTKEISNQVLERIQSIEGVETVGAMTGGSSILSSLGGGSSSNTSTMYVQLEENGEVSSVDVSEKIVELCADLDCEVTASSSAMSGSAGALTGNGISIYVYGNDMDELRAAAQKVAEVLEKVEGTEEVSDGIEETDPELHISVDKDAAMKEGLTVAQVYGMISEQMTGEKAAGSLLIDQNSYDCVVIGQQDTVATPKDIRNLKLTVTGQDGEEKEIFLKDIADIQDTDTLASINRRNQKRYLNVTAAVAEGYNVTKVSDAAQVELDKLELPKGITLEASGEYETIMDAMKQLVEMLLLGLVLVYMIMVAQFQSLKSPFIIMFTIPLAFTGGFLALLISNMEVSIIAMIGFIMLCGIIVNNGIVLVDYINQLRREGMEKREAIIEAGATRMRPILMTSITTILGLAVMVLGIGNTSMGAEMMQPLAIVCIGGLTYATILTLFVVPVLYDLMNGNKMRIVTEEDLEIINE